MLAKHISICYNALPVSDSGVLGVIQIVVMAEESNKKVRHVLGLKVERNSTSSCGTVQTVPGVPSGQEVVLSKRGAVVVVTKGRESRNLCADTRGALTVDEKQRRLEALGLSDKSKSAAVTRASSTDKGCDIASYRLNDECLVPNDITAASSVTTVEKCEDGECIDNTVPADCEVSAHETAQVQDIGNEQLHGNAEQSVVVGVVGGDDDSPKSVCSDVVDIAQCKTEEFVSGVRPHTEASAVALSEENADSAVVIGSDGSEVVVQPHHAGRKTLSRMSAADLKKRSRVQNLDALARAAKVKEKNEILEVDGGATTVVESVAQVVSAELGDAVPSDSSKKKRSSKYKKSDLDDTSDAQDEGSGVTHNKNVIAKKATKGKVAGVELQRRFHPLQFVGIEAQDGADDIEVVVPGSSKSPFARRKKGKKHALPTQQAEKIVREVVIPNFISVQDLALRASEKSATIIKELMKLGVIATANQTIDADTAELVIGELGHIPKRFTDDDYVKKLLDGARDTQEHERDWRARAPIVTVMGHVDHGKTSLLDALRSTDVVSREYGGITQHIGAYQVTTQSGRQITFLDTPGHEAFTSMRMRGAKVTDIVVLVVAADDGVKAQTVEAINHAKAAEVQIIVAINKVDKPNANINAVKNELLSYGLVPEDMGGDVMVVPVSAQNKVGLDKLEDAILLSAEFMGLNVDHDGCASGSVIESKIDKGRGAVVTLLVQDGALQRGDIVVAGSVCAKIRAMRDDKGHNVYKAGPSTPVEVLGFGDAPVAGDDFMVLRNEKIAKELADFKLQQERVRKGVIVAKRNSVEQLFSEVRCGMKELVVIVKADVQGSMEAIVQSLSKFVSNEVRVRTIHCAVGGISESDVVLAITTHGIILGFNVRANANAKMTAKAFGVDVRYYSVIYDLLDDIKNLMSGLLSPIQREKTLGGAVVKQVFSLSKYGKVAGCYVTDGMVRRGADVRVLRDNVVIHTGKIKSLKRQKDDVKDVKVGFECGISLDAFEDIAEGDAFEIFEIIEECREFEV